MLIAPLLKLMGEKHASDLFFSVGAPINIKINGVAMPVNAQVLDAENMQRIAYEVMGEARTADFKANKEMNFSFAVPEIGSFRANVFRQRSDIAMVIRYLSNDIPAIEDLKLPAMLKELIMQKRGLVLVVGSTGSGKSTTLAAMIEHRNLNRTGHILTIEDPIEFVFKHKKSIVNQREVGMDTQSYTSALVNAMREAPDVMVIGEIRDRDTLQHALIYAQTGHLCLSTMHANNSYHVLNRIINFFPLEHRASLLLDLSICLRCVVSQRLVRGVDGKLVPAVEVLLNTKHIAELIKDGKIDEIKEAMEQSLAPDSQTFEQALFKLYSSGQISLDEAMANSDSPTNLSWIINNAKTNPDAPQNNTISGKFTKMDDLKDFTITLDKEPE